MKVAFIIQGEGRGHLSQAICLKQMIAETDISIVNVFYGTSKKREVPKYLTENFKGLKISYYKSPSFIYDKNNKKLRIVKSFLCNSLRSFSYFKSIRSIHKIVKKSKPDVIINFYDLIGGLMNLFYHTNSKYICLSHHFYFNYTKFNFPKTRRIERKLLLLHSKIVAFKADKILALSFRKETDLTNNKLFIVPPLVRQEIINLKIKQEDLILCYLLKDGYFDEVEKSIGLIKSDIHLFCEKTKINNVKGIIYHETNDKEFISLLSTCKGYATSAGFDSICEAMYLQKPVMMVPVKNHFEQFCNAIDAYNEGAGIIESSFDLNKIVEYIPNHNKNYNEFKDWVNSAKNVFLYHLKN